MIDRGILFDMPYIHVSICVRALDAMGVRLGAVSSVLHAYAHAYILASLTLHLDPSLWWYMVNTGYSLCHIFVSSTCVCALDTMHVRLGAV